MKKIFILYVVTLSFVIVSLSPSNAQSVAINTDGTIASSSAILDIKSTTKGMLIPRVALTSTTDNTTITSATISLLIYNTAAIGDGATAVTPGYYYWTGSAWDRFATGSANNIWTQNGTNIYNSNTGMIGIGTSNYQGKLTVQSVTNDFGLVHTDGNIKIGTWVGGVGETTGGWLGTRSDHPLHFFTSNGNPQMTILQNGNVGIGTTAPDFKFTVASSIIQVNNNTHVLNLKGRNPVLAFSNENGVSYGYIKMWSNAPFAPYTNGLVIGANPGYPLFFSTNNYGVSMAVADNGNIGMGTTTPAAKLHINKDGEALRLSGSQSYVSLFNGADYKGYLWNKGTDDIELGTALVNTNGNLNLSIKGTPYLSIKNNGQVSINGAPGVYLSPNLTVTSGLALKGPGGLEWQLNGGDSRLYFFLNGDVKAYIDVDGEYVQPSDVRLKENISPYKSVLDHIKNLKVSTYRYKSNAPDSRSFGLIAQNVAEYFPEIVSETPGKDGQKMLAIAYAKTGVLALKAIQEQQVIIEKQQQQIDLLIKRIEALERK